MRELTGVADTIRDIANPFARQWVALETDYKSVTLAGALMGLVVGLGIHIPW